jgi:Ca2+/Na+ antiporter
MELKYSLYTMMIGSFIIQFIVMSCIMTNSYKNITFSVGKFYMSVIMALLMGLLEVFMFDIHMRIISLYYYLILFFILSIFIYLYRNQIYIEDKDYYSDVMDYFRSLCRDIFGEYLYEIYLTTCEEYNDLDKKEEQTESEITERCWKGYKQKGMKTMFGKRYPNCVKKKG